VARDQSSGRSGRGPGSHRIPGAPADHLEQDRRRYVPAGVSLEARACWYAVRRGKTAHWLGSRDQSTIWDAVSPKMIMGGSTEEKLDHPTQKPVELMRRPIMNHTRRGDVVWEPFLGSDTTLAAAESIGRICCGFEIEPRFVDQV